MKKFVENQYILFLEDKYLRLLMATQVAPLCKELRENEKTFSFISDREFSTTGGKINMQCDKISTRVSRQLKAISMIINQINAFEDMPISETAQGDIYRMVTPIKDYAVKYGYCDEALELIKILRNPSLVGIDFASCSSEEDIAKILNAYGKRAILEGKQAEFKDKADQVITDVVCGYYGEESRKKLSQEQMDKIYKETTVVKGEVVFKMDGSHERKSKDKV